MRVLLLLLTPPLLLAGPVEDADVSSDDYYAVLGLARDCDAKAVKKHYRKLAMEWHPDKNKAPDAEANFKKIAEAYEVLSDAPRRREYDFGKDCFDNDSVGVGAVGRRGPTIGSRGGD